MRIDVAFGPTGLTSSELAGRPVFVIDVLRATTTICAALHAGARAVVPVSSTEEALRMAQTLGSQDAMLAGERNCEPIPGFALGNSPVEMTSEVVQGRTIVMTTTNGTRALLAAASGSVVYAAAGVNLDVAAARARELLADRADLLVLCAAREQAFAMDDAFAAGQLILAALEGRRIRKGLNDAALVSVDLARRYGPRFDRALKVSAAGRHLRAIGRGDDVARAAELNRHPVLPVMRDRRIVDALAVPALRPPVSPAAADSSSPGHAS
ncbi:MAG: 2-phosphosulfolactate phosphatase [Gemmatimonadota bacterium]|nr:2-phosphosulfolactate phosphatase [Gemmatimonadota bacterium]